MKTILCYGDSNTYGYNPSTGGRYPRDIRWTGRLQEILKNNYYIVEEGCNGRTTRYEDTEEPWKDGRPYLKPCLNSHKPVDIIILMLGSNDLKDYFNATAEDIADGCEQLINIIKDFCREKDQKLPQIILLAPPALGDTVFETSPFGANFPPPAVEKSKALPKLYEAVAKKHHTLYLNTQDYIEPSPKDSLHLEPEAHEILANQLAKIIRENEIH